MLNIFRSDFSIRNSTFVNSYSDAFDSDFSTGEIIDTIFKDLGNDAIDLSGSSVYLSNIEINSALDKAISLGKNSESYGNNIKILNSNLGIAQKIFLSFHMKVLISQMPRLHSLYIKKKKNLDQVQVK